MAKIATVGKSELYVVHNIAGSMLKERGDCAVRAIAAVTNTDYVKVHAMMADMGRKHKRGTPWDIIWATLNELGFKAVRRNAYDFIHRYPGSHATALRSVTTHHPDRFKDVWRDGNAYIFHTTRHVAAVVNGVNHDWTRGRACRVKTIWEIVPATPAEQELQAERDMMVRYEM